MVNKKSWNLDFMVSIMSVTNLLTVLFFWTAVTIAANIDIALYLEKTPSKILFSVHAILNWRILFMPVKPEIVFFFFLFFFFFFLRDSLKRQSEMDRASSKLNRARTGLSREEPNQTCHKKIKLGLIMTEQTNRNSWEIQKWAKVFFFFLG